MAFLRHEIRDSAGFVCLSWVVYVKNVSISMLQFE